MSQWKALVVLLCIVFWPMLSMAAHAQDLSEGPTADEQQAFDEILTPVMKIYKLVKYGASIVAALALVIAGLAYMFSANNVQRRDQSKSWVGYIFMGLVVIWATPTLVGLLA